MFTVTYSNCDLVQGGLLAALALSFLNNLQRLTELVILYSYGDIIGLLVSVALNLAFYGIGFLVVKGKTYFSVRVYTYCYAFWTIIYAGINLFYYNGDSMGAKVLMSVFDIFNGGLIVYFLTALYFHLESPPLSRANTTSSTSNYRTGKRENPRADIELYRN
ncbi:hypothetical protein BC833DRAFT_620352 [Globomyces pollinis-pini]|nr:hypothetical protein BC833DRAFT_620352 [Globomyces pollinis-pini]